MSLWNFALIVGLGLNSTPGSSNGANTEVQISTASNSGGQGETWIQFFYPHPCLITGSVQIQRECHLLRHLGISRRSPTLLPYFPLTEY